MSILSLPLQVEPEPSYLGIDPGVSGGIALVSARHAQAWNMPETEGDLVQLMEAIDVPVVCAAIEKVHAFPGREKTLECPRCGEEVRCARCQQVIMVRQSQGVAGMFTFGRNFGILLGVLAARHIKVIEVSPGIWQRAMGCLTKGDKNVTKRRCQQLFPKLKVTHAVSDALLIAEYCRKEQTW